LAIEKHDRRFGTFEQARLVRIDVRVRLCLGEARHEHGERLGVTVLALAKAPNRRLARRVDDELEPADVAHGHDRALFDEPCRSDEGTLATLERTASRVE